MNYFPHHIGDYDSHTSHLSWLEDAAYRRLLCLYYRTEKPLPSDHAQCCRLVRAGSRQERQAVAQVLGEFFDLREDGWHSERCDREIAKAQSRSGEEETKREAERERQRRHRERRKELFEELRGHGVVPPYDTSTEELQRLLVTCESRGGHADVTQPVTRDVTANQEPITNNQEPNHSVPNGTGGEPPAGQVEDPPAKSPEEMRKAEIWGAGKSLLMEAGEPKAQCGSFLGKLVGDYGDVIVLEAVRAAVSATPADPKEYLKATCQRLKGERATPMRANGRPSINDMGDDAQQFEDPFKRRTA